MTCPSCSSNCLACTNATYCTSCDPTYYYLDLGTTATCETACPNTHYSDSTNFKCVICSSAIPNCTKCVSQTECTECKPGTSLYYTKEECYVCHQSCKSCTGGA